MPFTVTNCEQFIRLTLGGKPDAAIPTLELVNMTGFHFTGMSQWRFLQRKTTLLNTVASQTYVVPPSDFGGIVPDGLAGVGTNALYIESNYTTINKLRNQSQIISTGSPYLYAVVDTTPSGSTPAVRHIELFPTPTTSVTGAIALVYHAIWANLSSEVDYIPIPDYCKTLFLRVLMAHARGLQREETGDLSQRLGELASSPEFVNAVRQDRAMQTDLGEMVGALSTYQIDRGRQIFSGTILGP